MRKNIGLFMVFGVITVSCSNILLFDSTNTPIPTLTLTSTATAISTPTLTPTNTNTPTITITPTPLGGGSGLIAYERADTKIVTDVINLEGNILYTLGNDDEWAGRSAWSQDGSKLFYLTFKRGTLATSFHSVNSDGTNIQDLFSSNIRDFSFSPDFKKILYTKGGINLIPAEIFIADFDGSSISKSVKLQNGFSPVWSPDGTRIAFMNRNAGNLPFQIYVINTDGSNFIALTTATNRHRSDNSMFPSWSPDGSKIIFSSNREDGIWKIYIMNSDGSNIEKLNDDGNYPSFSPDGKKVIFTSGNGSRIYIMNIDGTDMVQLVSCLGCIYRRPVWSLRR